jgi:hypothetical protein
MFTTTLTKTEKLHNNFMYNEQTNAHLLEVLLYCSLFIAPTCVSANLSSSGSSYLVPAKLHNHVHTVLVVFFLRNFHLSFRIIKTVLAIDIILT